MLNRLIKIFTSLRLTVVLLGFGILLVFVGTVAQADEGLYQAQARYFRHWFVWPITMFGHKVPIGLPGGYLIGTLLLMNLTAAHIKRFQLTWKKFGIHLTHTGVILLLVGQLTTDMFSTESFMRLVAQEEGKSYSESGQANELAIIDVTNPDYDEVVAVPESRLKATGEIRPPKLPFTVRVKDYHANSEPRLLAPASGEARTDVQGIGRLVDFAPRAVTAKMDDRNIPAATVELVTDKGSLGSWAVSNWVEEQQLAGIIRRQSAGALSDLLDTGQQFTHDSRTYRLAMRPSRYYKPFTIQLLQFTHAKYRGTDTPKDFASRIRLTNPKTGEDRETKIYMNNPLRYGGETFYQGSFDKFDPRVSILQVVRNPSWLAPYFACLIVAAGLIVQFMIHLVGFVGRRKTA